MAAYDPFERGPYPAGVRTIEAVDRARNRRFPIEIWYPATPGHAGQDTEAETQDVYLARTGAQRRQMAVRDAAVRAGRLPLLLFSHSSGADRRSATFLCTHLSSHGYVVAAMDHSERAAPDLASTPTESPAQKHERTEAWITSRVPDIQFLLDCLLETTPLPEVALDSRRIGIIGHSFGGWTALAAPEADSRIRAVVALAPGGSSHPRPGILQLKLSFKWKHRIPALYLAAENDTSLPLAGMYELFARAPDPKQMVILSRADHMHFADNVEEEHEAVRAMKFSGELAWINQEMRPITELCSGTQAHSFTKSLALAHMDASLRGRLEARHFLLGASARSGGMAT